MNTEERLQELLDKKDLELADMQDQLNMLYERENQDWTWTQHTHLDVDDFPNLPLPRLEIRLRRDSGNFGYAWKWDYDIVYQHLLDNVIHIPIGGTWTDNMKPLIEGLKNGNYTLSYILPFRDGAHIRHDSEHFGLPAFAIIDGEVYEI